MLQFCHNFENLIKFDITSKISTKKDSLETLYKYYKLCSLDKFYCLLHCVSQIRHLVSEFYSLNCRVYGRLLTLNHLL